MDCYSIDHNRQVWVKWFPVDGFHCEVEYWNGYDWVNIYDKRVIADSFWEGLGSVLCQCFDWEWEQADSQLAEWGIFSPDYEEVN